MTQKTLRGIKRAVVVGALALASVMPARAEGVTGNVRYISPMTENGSAYTEVVASYAMPGKISGFTGMDLFNDGGYSGKTYLTRDASKGLQGKLQFVHDNDVYTNAGLGLEKTVAGKNASLTIGAYPVWHSKDGLMDDKATLEYAASAKLPYNAKISSYGEVNLRNHGRWTFGELSLTRSFGPVELRYNPALKGSSNGHNDLIQRVSAGVNF
jgi:hypothetical protein